jgi:hypothetical protein
MGMNESTARIPTRGTKIQIHRFITKKVTSFSWFINAVVEEVRSEVKPPPKWSGALSRIGRGHQQLSTYNFESPTYSTKPPSQSRVLPSHLIADSSFSRWNFPFKPAPRSSNPRVGCLF